MASTRAPERWVAVVNPVAGRGRTARLLPELHRALDERGVEVRVASGTDDSAAIARSTFEAGAGVLVCGGDGTISLVAGVAAESGTGVIGIVPTGAGNDFARHLGLDHRRPLDALDLLTDGEVATIDLARASSTDGRASWCTTVANAGFDGEANRWANGVRALTGTPLYLAAVVRTLAIYRPQPLVVCVDGTEWRGRAWLIAVGNTRCYGGGMQITPDSSIDDGALDLCVIGETSLPTFLRRFPSVFRGTHVRFESVTTLRGRRIEVDADGGDTPLELWASGERVGPLPGVVEVVPAALRVLAPRAASGPGPATPP